MLYEQTSIWFKQASNGPFRQNPGRTSTNFLWYLRNIPYEGTYVEEDKKNVKANQTFSSDTNKNIKCSRKVSIIGFWSHVYFE